MIELPFEEKSGTDEMRKTRLLVERQLRDIQASIILVPDILALYTAFRKGLQTQDAVALTQTLVAAIVRTSTIVLPEP